MSDYLEQDIRAYALADAALVALIGQRWYSVDLPQGATFPAVTIQQISGSSEYTHQGHAGVERARFQVTVWTESHLAGLQVAARIETIFRTAKQAIGARITKVNRTDFGREPGQNIYKTAIDFMAFYRTN